MVDYKECELPELVDELENYVKAGKPTKFYRSVTGEPYVVLTSGGIKLEGASFSRFYKTKEDAIQAFRKQFSSYCSHCGCYQNNNDVRFRLYWRWKPTLREDFDGGFMVYARLLISDKPVTEAASVH